MKNPMDLNSKHILITGASSGIGRQCAVQASRLGAKVTIIARNKDNLKATIQMMERQKEHAYYGFDLNETNQIESLIRTIVSEQGPVDGLVHAAGVVVGRPLKMTTPKYVDDMLRIHLCAFIEMVHCLTKKGNMNDGASIVGISSAAVHRGDATWATYAAAKAGMDGFVGSAAVELGKRGVRINNVAFAMVGTQSYYDFVENSLSTYERIMGPQYMGVIDIDGAANTVMFLLSDAVKHITATTIRVYAGR